MDCPLCRKTSWSSDVFDREWSVCKYCRERYEREMTEAEKVGKGVSKQIDWSYYPAFRADPRNKNQHYLSFYDWAVLVSTQEKGKKGVTKFELDCLRGAYDETIETVNSEHKDRYSAKAIKERTTLYTEIFD